MDSWPGPGFSEAVYCTALEVEFAARGISFRPQCSFDVTYKGVVVGQGKMDFLVEEKVILENVAVRNEARFGRHRVHTIERCRICVQRDELRTQLFDLNYDLIVFPSICGPMILLVTVGCALLLLLGAARTPFAKQDGGRTARAAALVFAAVVIFFASSSCSELRCAGSTTLRRAIIGRRWSFSGFKST